MQRLIAAVAAAFLAPATSVYAQSAPEDSQPIKLGVILDMSGPYADATGEGSVTAARMAIGDFGGKLLGRPVEFLSADHQNKPDIATNIAKRWYDADGVTELLDVATSSAALAVMNVANLQRK